MGWISTSHGDSKIIQYAWYRNGLQDLRIFALAVWTIGLSHGLSAHYERFCVSYIDDILTYSKSFSDHLHHLRLVLTRLSDAGLRMRADKCIWAQHKLPYLGFVLSGEGIEPEPKKLAIISEARPPQNAKMLKSFLGLTAFYHRFIRRYAALTEPFRGLLPP